MQGGRQGEDRGTDCHFTAGTHHGQVYDPLLQCEDEPRRRESYQVLRKWLSRWLHQPVPRAQGAAPRSQVCNRGRLCQNLPESEKTAPVVQRARSRSEKYGEFQDRGLFLGVGTSRMILISGFIPDHADVAHAKSQIKHQQDGPTL